MDVVLRGMVEPAVNIYDLNPQIIVAYGEEITLTLDQYVSSAIAQVYVQNNLLQQLSGPSILPRTVLFTDVDPQTFNLRQRTVKFDNLTAELQDMLSNSVGGFFWLTDPGFSVDVSRVISFNSASLKYRQSVYSLASGSIGPASADSLIVGTLDDGALTVVLSLHALNYVPASNEVILGSYIYSTNSVNMQGGASIAANSVSYDGSISGVPSTNVQDALDLSFSRISSINDYGTARSSWSVNLNRAISSTVGLFLKRSALTGDPSLIWDEGMNTLTLSNPIPGSNVVVSSTGTSSTTQITSAGATSISGLAVNINGSAVQVNGPQGGLVLGSMSIGLISYVPIYISSSGALSPIISQANGDNTVSSVGGNVNLSGASILSAIGAGQFSVSGAGSFNVNVGGNIGLTATGGLSIATAYLNLSTATGTTTIDGGTGNLWINTAATKTLTLSPGGNLVLTSASGYISVGQRLIPTSALDIGAVATPFGNVYANGIVIPGGILKADGSTTMTGNLSLGGNKIIGVGTPSAATDAATVGWVQAYLAGYVFKAPARLATTGPGTLATSFAAGQTIDTMVLVLNDRILIKDQTNPVENGLYTVNATGAPTRATDADVPGDLDKGMTIFIEDGDENLDTGWIVTSANDSIPGTDPITFGQIFGPGTVVAGNGLGRTGNTLFVNVASAGGIQISSDNVVLKLADSTLQVSSSGVSVNQGSLSLASIGGTLSTSKGGTGIDSSALSGFAKITAGAWSVSGISTSDVTEGTRLYYTDDRVESKVNSLIVAGTGIGYAYDSILHTMTFSVSPNTTVQKINLMKTGVLQATRKTLNLIEGSNISLTVTDDGAGDKVDITVAATGTGEVNTASNVNTAGVGPFKQKTGVNLEFYGVAAASSKLTATLNPTNNTIDLDVTESNLTLNNIGGTLGVSKGGTNLSSYTVGDILYASASTTLSSLADVATGNALLSGGVGVAPAWGKVTLTGHVSGTLAIGNGGTGQITAALAFGALSPLTTKGDILGFSTVNARLPVGSDGQILIADSTQALGIKWGAATAYLSDPGGNGIVVRTSLNTTTNRTLTGVSARTTVTNGDGTAGNPTVDIASTYVGQTSITTLGTIGTGTWNGTAVDASHGGTGQTVYAIGDILYASSTTALSRLADIATGNALISGGVGVAPSWGKIDLTTTVTGDLPYSNLAQGSALSVLGVTGNATADNASIQGAANQVLVVNNGGTALAFGAVNLSASAAITGTLPIGNGGTGQITALAAYDALAPTTTQGDITVRGATTSARLALGTTSYVLQSNGTTVVYGQVSLTAGVTGILPVANGGSGTSTAFTTGSVLFAGASGVYSQSNANFFFDGTNFRLAIGANTFDGTSPEKLKVACGVTTSFNPVAVYGSINNYFQLRNQNTSTGTSASTDFVGTADNGSETTNYVDVGINSSTYSDASYTLTGINDSYLLNVGGNLVLTTGTAAKVIKFGTGGFLAANERMRLTDTALILGSTTAVEQLTVTGRTALSETTAPSATALFGKLYVLTSDHDLHFMNASGTAFNLNPLTTKGDLMVFGTDNARLAVGTNSYALVADSTQTLGVKWGQISLTAGVTGTLPVSNGGTGLATYAIGDILYASAATTVASLADVATGNALISGGVGVAPSYGKIGLTTHISGTLAIGNGGTGQTAALAAFDALAPTTTQGDITVRGTTTSARLALGTTSYVLQSNGTTVVYGQVSLTAGVTGTLPIGNGGTGQTTASAAMGALSPLTTKGDILGYSTVNARVPVGTDGYVLTADSTQALGVKWAAATGGAQSPWTGNINGAGYTLSSARIARRVNTVASSATPTINTDTTDMFTITALAANITSMTTNLSGTPVNGDNLEIRILDNGTARTITWGTSFASTSILLPATTIINTTLRVYLEWDSTQSKWMCVGVS